MATVLNNPFIPRRINPITGKTGPHPKQAEFLLDIGEETLFGGAAAGGKALYNKSMIPTPNGWTTVKDLRPGQQVFGLDGKPIEVLAVSEVMHGHMCWRLTFDDGSEVIADDGHRWLTFTAKDLSSLTRRDPGWRSRRREKRGSRVSGKKSKKFTKSLIARNKKNPPISLPLPTGAIRTTAEIAATLKSGRRANHAVPVAAPLDLQDVNLPIDPYTLGAWLGDGTSASSGFTSADVKIIGFIRDAGWAVQKRVSEKSGPYSWVIGVKVGRFYDFSTALRKLNLLGNKHVPDIYLRASRAQRLSLLQGLMDTDGTVAKGSGSAEFTNTKKKLAEAVVELACSLGHKATMREGLAKVNGRVIGPKWTVKWMPPDCVFRLPRKAVLQKLGTRRSSFRFIVKCERIESVPVQCIKVSAADGMFLTGKTMIPTHNSDAILMGALQFVEMPKYSALIFRKTFQELAMSGGLMSRSQEWLKNTSAKWNGSDKRWTFPSGSTLTFGYLDNANDRFRYLSSEFQFIGFDELTEFRELDYLYLFSRLRRLAGSKIPLRMRSGTNPGGPGHFWVKKRFLTAGAAKEGRRFIASKMDDNPSTDKIEYVKSLQKMDQFTRDQLLHGDWTDFLGNHFKPSQWKKYVNLGDAWSLPRGITRDIFRHAECSILIGVDWAMGLEEENPNADQAAKSKKKKKSDFTCFVASCLTEDGRMLILDVVNDRIPFEHRAEELDKFCFKWRPDVVASEDDNISHHMVTDCRRYQNIPEIQLLPISGKDKVTRASPAIIRGGKNLIWLPDAKNDWDEEYIAQLAAFTGADGEKDDMVDATGILGRLADRLKPLTLQRGTGEGPILISEGRGVW